MTSWVSLTPSIWPVMSSGDGAEAEGEFVALADRVEGGREAVVVRDDDEALRRVAEDEHVEEDEDVEGDQRPRDVGGAEAVLTVADGDHGRTVICGVLPGAASAKRTPSHASGGARGFFGGRRSGGLGAAPGEESDEEGCSEGEEGRGSAVATAADADGIGGGGSGGGGNEEAGEAVGGGGGALGEGRDEGLARPGAGETAQDGGAYEEGGGGPPEGAQRGERADGDGAGEAEEGVGQPGSGDSFGGVLGEGLDGLAGEALRAGVRGGQAAESVEFVVVVGGVATIEGGGDAVGAAAGAEVEGEGEDEGAQPQAKGPAAPGQPGGQPQEGRADQRGGEGSGEARGRLEAIEEEAASLGGSREETAEGKGEGEDRQTGAGR